MACEPEPLARREVVCFIKPIRLQRGRTLGGVGRTPKAALAALLSFLLLLATTLSASQALHQSLHRDSAANGHVCLICSLVKGQVNMAAVACVLALAVFYYLGNLRLSSTAVVPGFDYRFSPSRAPPQS